MKIQKRDGRVVPYEEEKIREAIHKANNEVEYKISVEDLKKGNLSTLGENNYISIAALEATLINGEKEGEEKSTVTSACN